MNDMLETIHPKSDQLNADDLIGGTMTITVTKVNLTLGKDQPVAISFEGDNGKPYMPGKSMRRVLVMLWGPDANAYVGRSMTLYRDEKVLFGGLAVGGIRISAMSHIDGKHTLMLTATRAQRKPFVVEPLDVAPAAKPKKEKSPIDLYSIELQEKLKAASEGDVDGLSLFWANTGERRMALNIPDERLEKMTLAVQKVLNPEGA